MELVKLMKRTDFVVALILIVQRFGYRARDVWDVKEVIRCDKKVAQSVLKEMATFLMPIYKAERNIVLMSWTIPELRYSELISIAYDKYTTK